MNIHALTPWKISAKVALAVAAVCDRRQHSNSLENRRRSQSAATGLLQRFPWKAISAMLLVVIALRASADPAPKMPKAERNYTGVVISVDTNAQVFWIKRSLLPVRQFAYGDKCEMTLLYSILQNGGGTSPDLRPGEKVTVSYQDSHGVHIADRIEQQPMQFSGTVKELNPEKHRLTLHRWVLDKRMTIAPDCIIVFGSDKTGTLADIHSGDHVVVIYETPGGNPMAWQITKTNAASLAR
jgi:hypothetical protein